MAVATRTVLNNAQLIIILLIIRSVVKLLRVNTMLTFDDLLVTLGATLSANITTAVMADIKKGHSDEGIHVSQSDIFNVVTKTTNTVLDNWKEKYAKILVNEDDLKAILKKEMREKIN